MTSEHNAAMKGGILNCKKGIDLIIEEWTKYLMSDLSNLGTMKIFHCLQ